MRSNDGRQRRPPKIKPRVEPRVATLFQGRPRTQAATEPGRRPLRGLSPRPLSGFWALNPRMQRHPPSHDRRSVAVAGSRVGDPTLKRHDLQKWWMLLGYPEVEVLGNRWGFT